MWASKKNQAFTIVELLIVIVVIGILAAITIVAFNGVQERARMAAAQAFATQLRRSPDFVNATAVWAFNECSGGNVGDVGDGNNAGTIVGTVAWSTDTPSGTGCSVSLNGTTRVTTSAPIGASYYVKAAWVKLTSCAGSNNFISGDGSAFYGCTPKAGHNGSWNAITSSVSIDDGKWHHLALIYDAGNLTMYVDGKKTAGTSGVSAPSSTVTTIGALNSSNNFTGLIDDVLIFAR